MKNEINRLNKNIESINHLIDSCILHNELKLKKTTIEDLKSTHMLIKNRVNHLKKRSTQLKFYWTNWNEKEVIWDKEHTEIKLDNERDRIGYIWKFNFNNNYGLSVARHSNSYQSEEGYFETFKTVNGKIIHKEERILNKKEVIERIKEIKLQTLPL